ncbi:MAG: FAD-dependent oxidoreductase [Alphaproteobacteria bacterium]|nr:FAD-dependent oxidoreductase [Alphaproteobacteria bacterium]MBV8549357.1 FAD-dependent oxidoreductase [Alphaproteobacteria bacterium]
MAPRHTHIVGAGVAGLAAALQLALSDEKVTLYEAAPFAGGRCRSFYDRELGHRIDNGNHLVLSGNVAIRDYLHLSQATETMGGPGKPLFPFMDMKSGERWNVHMNKGPLPFWLLDKKRRVPGATWRDYLSAFKVMTARGDDRVGQRLNLDSTFYKRFWEPLVIGALNTEAEIASAPMLATIMGQTFLAGGEACIPLIPKVGLSETFVQPTLNVLRQAGVDVKYNQRLRAMAVDGNAVRQLDFNGTVVDIAPDDWVVFALPAWVVQNLLPDVQLPNDFRSIINAHFRVDGVQDPVGFAGVVNGLAEWVFAREGVASVTISCAERYGEYPVRDMVPYIWKDVARLYDLDPDRVPPHRIFKEKYATFAATPEQNLRRPAAYVGWKNLALAGEWTATGLPTTIESAIRSGFKAAQLVLRWTAGQAAA